MVMLGSVRGFKKLYCFAHLAQAAPGFSQCRDRDTESFDLTLKSFFLTGVVFDLY